MARKNIFEILEKKYDINGEIEKIYSYLKRSMINLKVSSSVRIHTLTIEKLIDQYLIHLWKQRGSNLSCFEIRNKLGIFSIPDTSEQQIIALEYFINIINLIEIKKYKIENLEGIYFYPEYQMFKENINLLINHLNYVVIEDENEEKMLLVPNNPLAVSVSSKVPEYIAFGIMKYNHYELQGNLSEKKKILLSIAGDFEPLLKSKIDGFKDYFDKANYMLNNLDLRHNNKEGSYKKEFVAKMTDKKLEEWYDELYELLLFCFEIKENKDRKDKITELQDTIEDRL